jgi:hypothetical protein
MASLGHLFAIAKDAKLGLAAEHFTSPNQAGVAAFVGQGVIS